MNDITETRSAFERVLSYTTPAEDDPNPEEWDHAREVLHRWRRQGRGIAVYRNSAFDSSTFGQVQFATYGTPEASIEAPEPPTTFPFGHIPNHWTYQLVDHCPPEKEGDDE